MTEPVPEPARPTRTPSRRTFLRAGGLAGTGLAVGGAVGAVIGHTTSDGRARSTSSTTATSTAAVSNDPPPVAFYGQRQAGVTTRTPAHLRFTAYDLRTPTGPAGRAALRALLQNWTTAAAAVMSGRWLPEQLDTLNGTGPRGLSVTVGVGARAVRLAGAVAPAALAALPAFAGEMLDAARSGGDLAVQVCGDDPFVVASAAQALTTLANSTAAPRWSQAGFVPGATGNTEPAATPRNLMGQLDGTDNPTGSRQELAVWVSDPATAWMTDGTYLVIRRIRMRLPAWRALTIPAREAVIGRSLSSGAPLSGGDEHSTPDFAARDSAGDPVIAANAHLRLTHPSNNAGATMFRRAYSYDDGLRPDGSPNAGLFFQSFQTDPHQVFVPIQTRLAAEDALADFVVHETSAVFAILPGAHAAGQWLGQAMFT